MNIRRLRTQHFTTHDDSTLFLPERGVVLVTGANGAGKSSLVEGVAWGLWGRTLRGSAPWRGDAKPPCVVEVDTDTVSARRMRSGAKADLAWSVDGKTSEEWPTATKAQEALDGCILDFDLWRRSHVFSSSDASHFTTSTDHERKRLIEGVLGLQRFDDALTACRADLAEARRIVQSHGVTVEALRSKAADAERRIASSNEALATIEQPDLSDSVALVGKSADDLRKLVASCDRDIADAQARIRDAEIAGADHAATARNIESTLARLREEACPTCSQAIPSALRKRLESEATEARASAAKAKEHARTSLADVQASLDELREERAHLDTRYQSRRQAELLHQRGRDEATRAARTIATLNETKRQAESDLDTARKQLALTEEELAKARVANAELDAAERALGMRGIRAHILGHALSGLETVANGWLSRLGLSDLRLSLRSYSEKKTGGTSDAIGLEVAGAGGGHGYKGASGGERRRLDVALLLAMAEVAGAAHGKRPGTLWFDEVFDCLDEEGTEAVANALVELASERAVVVVTHSAQLVSRMPGARRVVVANGRLDG